MTLNSIGLDTKKTQDLADELNQLLANFQLYYQNLRGIHWKIQGRAFFNLNEKFCFSNYEDLISSNNIDIIYIALPHNFHFEWIIKCLENKSNFSVSN